MTIQPAINQALAILPTKMTSDAARLLMLAIQKQEDPELLRYQRVKRTANTAPENVVSKKWAKGPARGAWQFEQGGGVKGVLQHSTTSEIAEGVCKEFGILATAGSVWRNLETNDVLAACFARLLLWTDPKPMPSAGDEAGAWALYLRTWRPGAYTNGTPEQRDALCGKWLKNYRSSMAELGLS